MKTFYKARTPEEAIKIYFKEHDNLYNKIKEGIIKDVLDSMISSWNSLKVLEVGAGGGIWTEFFIKQEANITCVDSCEAILKGNAKLHPEAKFVLADATTLTLKEKFDLVFAKDIIEHIEKDLLFLKKMNRHLKIGGTLLINTQNAFSLNYSLGVVGAFVKGVKWCGWDPTHVRFYTVWSLNKKLRMTGFKAIKFFGCYYFPYRTVTREVFGRVIEKNSFHCIEILRLYDKFPFNIMGWNIGIIAKKISRV